MCQNTSNQRSKPIVGPSGLIYFGCVVALATLLSGCERSKAPNDSALAATQSTPLITPEQLCASERATRLQTYERKVADGRPWEAANALRDCAQLLADAELQVLVSEAERAEWLLVARDNNKSTSTRIDAIEKIRDSNPSVPLESSLRTLHRELIAEVQRKAIAEQKAAAVRERAIAARKKREGVSIGMSQDEVLASSWGKPRQINRSVYSFGTHEQWVYHGSNYLYFRNGVLDSIQTGR